ncbi:MAG: response regulator transcription factor [Elusimicrobia bacterium]|nr:response regulator transcription factor [Elusimicrobiota bacterium]
MRRENRGRIKVFLVDDHPIVREGVRSYLSGQGSIAVVGEASDGAEALRKARALSPDVFVLDISLPSLDGGELARRLRRAVPKARVVAFSIHSSEEYVVRMARCGARGYVMKDEPTSNLLEAIKRVAKGGLYFPPDMTDAVLSLEGKLPATRRGVASLSAREREVLVLVAEGMANKQIARKLGLSVRTAEAHRERLSRKLSIRTVAGLTKYAIRHGLTSLR